MAKYKTILTVGADTSEADRDLDKLKRKAERIGRDRAESPLGAESTREGDAFGRAAAKQIGRALVGFAMNEVAGVAFAAARTPGGNNVNVDRAETALGGALVYGASGAVVGGVPGAIVGAMLGAVTNLARHEIELAQQIRENRLARANSEYKTGISSSVRASDAAFAELSRGRTVQEQIEMLKARRADIANGSGQFSIRSVKSKIAQLEAEGDVSSDTYKVLNDLLDMQRQREAALGNMIVDAQMATHKPHAIRAEDFSDAYSRRGLFNGADVAASAMSEQLAIGREQVQLLRRIADWGTDRIHSPDSFERASTVSAIFK